MTKDKNLEDKILREKAEEHLKKKHPKSTMPLSEMEMKKLIHELEVHQIELEMQNEELILAKAAALAASEKYSELYDFTPSGYVTLSKEGTILELNFCTARMIGKDRSRLINSMFRFFVSEAARPIFNLFLEKVFTGKSKEICELTLSCDGAAPIDVHVEGIIPENGEYCIASIIDITAHKRAVEELRELSQAVEQSPASIFITNISGNIEYANPKTIEITGYSREELIGANPRVLSSGEMPKEEYKKLWDTITSGKEWHGEFHNKKKNGELYWESALISPIFDSYGKIKHYLAVKENITDRKLMVGELVHAKERAVIANRLKDAFIANMSHEIRTPLNGIIGMTSIIIDSFLQYATKEDERFFASIKRSSKRLIDTVEQILNFSRLQVGEFPIKIMDIYLSSILQTLVATYNSVAAEKSIKIRFNSTADDDTIIADPAALNIAFGNVIDNAVKFTEEGNVDVALYRDEENKLCVKISDTGIGLSNEYQSHIFEPYTQEIEGYSRPYEGLGLGLPISKKLFDLNGASIAVKSNKGEGAVFSIRFDKSVSEKSENPREADEIKEVRLPDVPKKVLSHKPAILVVEDDPANQFFIASVLKGEYDVVIAHNAEKGLKIFTDQSFDLILMDISLKKGLNGLELTRVIRSGRRNPDIPIIVVTGHAFPEDHRKAVEAGCNDFLTKPFQSAHLIEKIKKLVE